MTLRLALAASLLLALVSSSLAASLDLAATSNSVCPVIRYSAAVEEMSTANLASMKLNALQHDQAMAAPANHQLPYRVVVTPIAYTKNASIPTVDWIDLHFRVNQEAQQNVQMKVARPTAVNMAVHSAALPSAAVAPELDSSMMKSSGSVVHSAPTYSFGPIFLSSSDELSFAHTICSSTIDCNTAAHSFKPAEQEHANLASATAEATTVAPVIHAPAAIPHEVQSSVVASSPSSMRSDVSVCPAVEYRHKVTCGDFNCKFSFINLSKDKPCDWVDIHVSSNALSFISTVSGLSAADTATHLVTQNNAMELVAGPRGRMAPKATAAAATHPQLSSALFGGESSSASSVLAATANGDSSSSFAQVWQFGVPLEFHSGDKVEVAFSYSTQAVDCTTEAAVYTLQDEKEIAQHQQQHPSSVTTEPKVVRSSVASSSSHPASSSSSSSAAVPRQITIVTTTDNVMLPLSVARDLLQQQRTQTAH